MNYADYPRMLYHRTHDPVVVLSEEEEAARGREWSRTIPVPDVDPLPPPEPVEEPEPEEPEKQPEEPERPPKREPEPDDRRKVRKRA